MEFTAATATRSLRASSPFGQGGVAQLPEPIRARRVETGTANEVIRPWCTNRPIAPQMLLWTCLPLGVPKYRQGVEATLDAAPEPVDGRGGGGGRA